MEIQILPLFCAWLKKAIDNAASGRKEDGHSLLQLNSRGIRPVNSKKLDPILRKVSCYEIEEGAK